MDFTGSCGQEPWEELLEGKLGVGRWEGYNWRLMLPSLALFFSGPHLVCKEISQTACEERKNEIVS